jgi:hypothetical protein
MQAYTSCGRHIIISISFLLVAAHPVALQSNHMNITVYFCLLSLTHNIIHYLSIIAPPPPQALVRQSQFAGA